MTTLTSDITTFSKHFIRSAARAEGLGQALAEGDDAGLGVGGPVAAGPGHAVQHGAAPRHSDVDAGRGEAPVQHLDATGELSGVAEALDVEADREVHVEHASDDADAVEAARDGLLEVRAVARVEAAAEVRAQHAHVHARGGRVQRQGVRDALERGGALAALELDQGEAAAVEVEHTVGVEQLLVIAKARPAAVCLQVKEAEATGQLILQNKSRPHHDALERARLQHRREAP